MLGSNLLDTFAVLGVSVACYVFLSPVFLTVASWLVVALVLFSAIFDIGEVYSYSDYYKRAFWYFGDDLTTWMPPLLFLALLRNERLLSVGLTAAALLSGGRIGLLLILIQSVVIIYIYWGQAWPVARFLLLALLGGVTVYFAAVVSSPHAIRGANAFIVMLAPDTRDGPFEISKLGYGDCRLGTCFESKIKRPFRTRFLSAAAGMWMTLEGGFPGSRYPNTPEKFADLMIGANPWGINDQYGVTRDEWMRIGTIQSPYVGFGAGYGPALLVLVMGFIGAVCLVALWNLKTLAPDPFVAFTVFFIVNAVFNQTQAWLLPGPVLFAMGFSGTHIMWQFVFAGRRLGNGPLLASQWGAKEADEAQQRGI